MDTTKTDRRVLRTRRLLRESLLALILKKGFDNVTIEEITEGADVGRTTFYLHYRDKEDLLFECINGAVDGLVTEVSGIPLSAWNFSIENSSETPTQNDPILKIYQHVSEKSDLYRIILRGAGTGQTQNRVRDIIASAVSDFLEERVRGQAMSFDPVIPLEVFANYFAGSLLGLISWWLEAETPYSPESMTVMYQRLFFPGARDTLGVSLS
jgi:AcrR family transcriptional regulator